MNMKLQKIFIEAQLKNYLTIKKKKFMKIFMIYQILLFFSEKKFKYFTFKFCYVKNYVITIL